MKWSQVNLWSCFPQTITSTKTLTRGAILPQEQTQINKDRANNNDNDEDDGGEDDDEDHGIIINYISNNDDGINSSSIKGENMRGKKKTPTKCEGWKLCFEGHINRKF